MRRKYTYEQTREILDFAENKSFAIFEHSMLEDFLQSGYDTTDETWLDGYLLFEDFGVSHEDLCEYCACFMTEQAYEEVVFFMENN